MTLEHYRAKRNFKGTPEPAGKTETATEKGRRFVVQEHDARQLHYDFRLELDGVLKSWAVPRGPSLNPADKRLAVAVEDHPLDYANFEGSIPKGHYGAGAVIVWDRGEWLPIGDAHKDLADGSLEFELRGEKLKGRWRLVRMKAAAGGRHENWLLIKGGDQWATPEGAQTLLERRPESVISGRTIAAGGRKRQKSALAAAELAAVEGARPAKLPQFVEPMLATLGKTPTGPWLHEIKFDGYRLQARISGGKVTLLTRGGLDWTQRFGRKLNASLAALPLTEALLDGEVVVENANGASNFTLLQADLSEERSDRFIYYVFDLLHLDGVDLRDAPLTARKGVLAKLLDGRAGPVRLSEHFEEDGALVLRNACRLGLEGVVSKLRQSPYRCGRGKAWIKSKCSQRQEFVIGGFAPSTATPKAIGSLALGVYEGKTLRHVGRVGTGFTGALARDLYRRLEPLRVDASPFAARLSADERRDLRFVRPELVAEVDFRAWTGEGHLRHAAFRGLREDKPAIAIKRESRVAEKKPDAPRGSVELSHPDRIYWPDSGVTKAGLADYYAEVWPRISPFIVGRPLALLRCPEGIDGQRFFQKHAWKGADRNIILVPDPKAPKDEPLISIRNLEGLMALVQAATLEIHPWGSTLKDWERPDMITIDLDPGDGVPWSAVIAAANEARQRLKDSGLDSFVKTSGGKGLHVVAPLKPRADWPEAKAFTKAVAEAMANDSPQRFVATIAKAKRAGKIFVDYLRNQRGATSVAPYSTRARPGAPVSLPLDWEELGSSLGPASFSVENAPARLASLAADPWRGFREAAAPIPGKVKARKKAKA